MKRASSLGGMIGSFLDPEAIRVFPAQLMPVTLLAPGSPSVQIQTTDQCLIKTLWYIQNVLRKLAQLDYFVNI